MVKSSQEKALELSHGNKFSWDERFQQRGSQAPMARGFHCYPCTSSPLQTGCATVYTGCSTAYHKVDRTELTSPPSQEIKAQWFREFTLLCFFYYVFSCYFTLLFQSPARLKALEEAWQKLAWWAFLFSICVDLRPSTIDQHFAFHYQGPNGLIQTILVDLSLLSSFLLFIYLF